MNKKEKAIIILLSLSILTFITDSSYASKSFEFVPSYLILFVIMQLTIIFLIFKYYPSKLRIIGAGLISVVTLILAVANYLYIPNHATDTYGVIALNNTTKGTINFEENSDTKTNQDDEYKSNVSSQIKKYLTSGSPNVKPPETYDTTNSIGITKKLYKEYFPASTGSSIKIVSSTEKNGSIYAHIVTQGSYDKDRDMEHFNPEYINFKNHFEYMNVELLIRTDIEGNILSQKIIDVNMSSTISEYLPLQYMKFIPSNNDKVYIIHGAENGNTEDESFLYTKYVGYLDDDLNVMEKVTLQTLTSLYIDDSTDVIFTDDLAIIDDIVYILDGRNHHLVKFNLKDGSIENKKYSEELADNLWQRKESLASDGEFLFTIDMISQGEEQILFMEYNSIRDQKYPTTYQLSIYDNDFNYQEAIVFTVSEDELMFNNIYDFQEVSVTKKNGKYQISTPQVKIDIESVDGKLGYNSSSMRYQLMEEVRTKYFMIFSSIEHLHYFNIVAILLLPTTIFLTLTLIKPMEAKNEKTI